MYEYNVFPDANEEKFQSVCDEVRNLFPQANQEPLLRDVDGSLVQAYIQHEKRITVYNDVEIGALYVKSDIPLALGVNTQGDTMLLAQAAN